MNSRRDAESRSRREFIRDFDSLNIRCSWKKVNFVFIFIISRISPTAKISSDFKVCRSLLQFIFDCWDTNFWHLSMNSCTAIAEFHHSPSINSVCWSQVLWSVIGFIFVMLLQWWLFREFINFEGRDYPLVIKIMSTLTRGQFAKFCRVDITRLILKLRDFYLLTTMGVMSDSSHARVVMHARII